MKTLICIAVTIASMGAFTAYSNAEPHRPAKTVESMFKHSCYTAAALGQAHFPKAENEERVLQEAFRACNRGFEVSVADGSLPKGKYKMIGFACGFGVGYIFNVYGAGDEIQAWGFSKRAEQTALLCIDTTK